MNDQYQPYDPFASPALAPAAPPPPPAGGYDYGKAQASWYNAAPGTSIDQWVKDNPTFTQGITSSKNGEWMNLPGGQSFDAQRNFGVGQSTQWGDQQHDYATGRALTPAESAAAEAAWAQQHPGGGGVPASSAPQASPAPVAAVPDPMKQQLVDQLMKRAQQSLAVDSNDPTIQAQVTPFSAQQDRSARNHMADLAESAGPYANLQGEARLASERAGQATGAFSSGLVGQEIQARRTEIQQALTSMQGLLTSDQAMALQKELAYLDDATRRYGIDNQQQQATASLSNDWQKALLQNSQFNSDLGLKAENQYNYWDAINSGRLNG